MASEKKAVETRPWTPIVRFGGALEHLPWAVLGAIVLAAGAAYARIEGSRGAFRTGGAAGVLFLCGFLFLLRRRLGVKPFTRARTFYLAHVWLSTAGLGVAACHAGRLPAGAFGAALLYGFGLAVLSGFLLAAVHAFFKRALAAIEEEALLPEDIAEARERHAREMVELLSASTPELQTCLRRDVLGRLGRLRVLRAALGGRLGLARLKLGVEQQVLVGSTLAMEEQAVVRRAIAARLEHRELELEAALHRMRTTWVTLHVVLSAATLGLLVVHVALVVSFS